MSMLGTLDGKGNPHDPDPVERESAKVQYVVARAAPINFFKMRAAGISFVGMDAPTGNWASRRRARNSSVAARSTRSIL